MPFRIVCRACWIVLFLAVAACSSGAPKRLGKGCLDCHPEYADRFQGGAVHSPLRNQDCRVCHRNHGLIAGVYLQDPEPALCFGCHRGVAESLRQSSRLHSPVKKGQCSACHSPHNANHSPLLIREEAELCFSCHDRSGFEGAVLHGPLREGCRSCHSAHGSQNRFLLSKEPTALCTGCHSGTGGEMAAKHGGAVPPGVCLECHDPHASERAGLLRAFTHAPVAQGDCSPCHLSSGGSAPEESGKGGDICRRCHSRQMSEWGGQGAHEPAAEGDCSDCHAFHASDFEGMLRKEPEEICFDCHEDGRGAMAKSVHTPVRAGRCLDCHLPHRASREREHLLSDPPEVLCRQCHPGQWESSGNHPPVRSGCLNCHDSHESPFPGVLKKRPLDLCAACHEEVSDDLGRLSTHRPFASGQCSACHDPHGGGGKDLLKIPSSQTCAECHPRLEARRQNPGGHPPFREGECGTCHVSHSSDFRPLLVASTESLCTSCHARSRSGRPSPELHRNCAACHEPHGGEGDHYLRKSLPELCLGCHQGVKAFWERGKGHAPAMEGNCSACHDPHFADPARVPGPRWTGDLCLGCHLEGVELREAHNGIVPGGESCRECHDPHGGPDGSLTHPVRHRPFVEGDCRSCHPGALP